MKRTLLIAAFAALAGCSTAQQANITNNAAKLQQIVQNGCMVVQPTLTAVAALDPAVAAAATANGVFCSTTGAITVTSVQTLLSTGVPALEKAIEASPQIPADQKPIFIAAMGIFQLTLQNAMTVYGQAEPAASQ
ncbi:hypothetical protein C7410_115165 [Paraburkholderia silvatlantica]|uniref:Lipoprotein n=1 Tax=Paraburkholderia silvatlantica TaxID=321895 RepID=A0A2V4TSD2_9BURK|nr:hypothetical protein [Paraburkholderia silvatlantica]PYE21322.1 hypothetical protein C7410_115165 [Paraburkholderia silvatlantica]